MKIKFHDKRSDGLLTTNSRCTAQYAEDRIVCACIHNDEEKVLDLRVRTLDDGQEVSIPVLWCPFCGKNYKDMQDSK